MQGLDTVIFYHIEKAIKVYRQFAQKRLRQAGLNITVDQWLTLNCLRDNPAISQRRVAELIFKDTASVTRIISLLMISGYLKKTTHSLDGRRTSLTITPSGHRLLRKAAKVVEQYRHDALRGVDKKQVTITQRALDTIISNCDK